jgi:toxin ParE1/3/4
MPRARRVVWSPAAERDLINIWGYYARVASREVADTLLREIDRVGRAIGDNPLLSRDRGELAPGLRSVVVRPHVIFFRLSGDAVQIARVLHGRRDFPSMFAKEG